MNRHRSLAALLGGCAVILLWSCAASSGGDEDEAPYVAAPERVVGSFAFADQVGTLVLDFDDGKSLVRQSGEGVVVSGTLTIIGADTIEVTLEGTYYPSTGHLEATGTATIESKLTTYVVDGTYDPDAGFSGEISRTPEGGATEQGVIGGLGTSADELDIRVYLGTYGIDYEGTIDYNEAAEAQGSVDQDIGEHLAWGRFAVTTCAEFVVGMYQDDDDAEDNGVFYGAFADAPANTAFDLEDADGQGFGTGAVDNSGTPWTLSGSWNDQETTGTFQQDYGYNSSSPGYKVVVTVTGWFEGTEVQ